MFWLIDRQDKRCGGGTPPASFDRSDRKNQCNKFYTTVPFERSENHLTYCALGKAKLFRKRVATILENARYMSNIGLVLIFLTVWDVLWRLACRENKPKRPTTSSVSWVCFLFVIASFSAVCLLCYFDSQDEAMTRLNTV